MQSGAGLRSIACQWRSPNGNPQWKHILTRLESDTPSLTPQPGLFVCPQTSSRERLQPK